jgi:hypothetical protein
MILTIAAVTTFENVAELLVLLLLNSARFPRYVYQTSSQSGDKWLTYNIAI